MDERGVGMKRWSRYRWFQVGFVWMKSDDTRLDRPGFDWGWWV